MIVRSVPDEIVSPVTAGKQHADLAFHLAKQGLRLVFQRGGVSADGGRTSFRMGKGVDHGDRVGGSSGFGVVSGDGRCLIRW